MFKTIRFRIALWFVCLSGLVYLSLTFLSGFLFYGSLTNGIDEDLRVSASEIGHAIDLDSGKPHFKEWLRTVQTVPAQTLAVIQLYDLNGHLLEHHGPPGEDRLYPHKTEIGQGKTRVRVRSGPLMNKGNLVGYLQIELPTQSRDAAIYYFAVTMALVAPLVLLGLGVCSYIVADKATKPIQDNMQMLRRFLADAGHELNTPLSIIQARAESLERKLIKQNIATDDLTIITNSSRRLEKLGGDLMLLAEIESPGLKPEMVATNIYQLVKDVSEDFAPKFHSKNISFTMSDCPQLTVSAYPDALLQALSNLLENAFRYTDNGGSVNLSVKIDAQHVYIVVEDTGIGIPEVSLSHIYDRFYRVDKSRSRESGGAGLGLSIVKAIAEAHQGTVQAESQLGNGSKFTICLPLPN
jgi:signal transduction histidine kinase